jgi:uncharacterized membrane protein YkoI
MRRNVISIAVICLGLAGTANADGLSAERVRALVERGEILSLEEIIKRNEAGLAGRIIDIEIEQKRGVYLYEIKVLRADGGYREFKINASTGALVKEE